MAELQLDALEIDELRTFLGIRNDKNNSEELLDAPFRLKIKYKRRTRFSDGSFPVFYSSLDAVTAQAEVKHWLPKFIGHGGAKKTVFFRQFSCTFEGLEMDLKSKVTDWPDLVHDDDYTFCNKIGAEAVELELDGIVTLSARRSEGENLPIFSRNAIRNPELDVLMAMTFHSDTNRIDVEQFDE